MSQQRDAQTRDAQTRDAQASAERSAGAHRAEQALPEDVHTDTERAKAAAAGKLDTVGDSQRRQSAPAVPERAEQSVSEASGATTPAVQPDDETTSTTAQTAGAPSTTAQPAGAPSTTAKTAGAPSTDAQFAKEQPDRPDADEAEHTADPARDMSGTEAAHDAGDRDGDDSGVDEGDRDHGGPGQNRVSPEQFAAEHDPADHDIAEGEEFRQPGDWTADDEGPQVQQYQDPQSHALTGDAGDGAPEEASPSASDAQSGLDEIRDGGYGVGSAAPLDDGRVPLGHPVKAWHDTQTYVTPDHWAYGDAQPHVWFTDADAAERAGFHCPD